MPQVKDIDFAGRVAVVTGASRGIGHALALALAKAGAHIVALARTEGALTGLDDEIRAFDPAGATLVPLDLGDFDAIDRLGAALYERHGRLDILIGNAGLLGPITPIAHIEPKDWDKVMAINLTANYRLIRSFDLLLRNAPAGRAVFVSSSAAQNPRAFWGTYAVSKAALESLVRTYALEIEQSNATANLLNPGRMRTRMRATAMPGEDPLTLKTPDELAPDVLDMLRPGNRRSGELYDFPTRSWKPL